MQWQVPTGEVQAGGVETSATSFASTYHAFYAEPFAECRSRQRAHRLGTDVRGGNGMPHCMSSLFKELNHQCCFPRQ